MGDSSFLNFGHSLTNFVGAWPELCRRHRNEQQGNLYYATHLYSSLLYFLETWKKLPGRNNRPAIGMPPLNILVLESLISKLRDLLPPRIARPDSNTGDAIAFTDQLSSFFEAWDQLPSAIDQVKVERPPLSESELRHFINDFGPTLQEARASGSLANIWYAAGLGRSEVKVVSVLCWFLDCLADHGQGHLICEAFLSKISDRVKSSTFPTPRQLLDQNNRPCYRATTEVCPLGEKESRVDVEVAGPKLLMFIEAKIGAVPDADQLVRYHCLIELKAAGRHWGIVYLTPSGKLPEGIDYLPNTVAISWRDVASAMELYANQVSGPWGRKILHHYVRQFAHFIQRL